MNKKIIDKFFTNQATPDETRKVLEWFESSEGKKYLQKRLDVDFGLMDRRELKELVPELESEMLYSAIHQSINKKRNIFSLHRRDWIGYSIKVAAALLVIAVASLFLIIQQQYVAEQLLAEQQPIIFQTQGEETKNITLADGSVINLNENSEIVVSPDYLKGDREITLTGEAFFDVEHNPDQPFIIHTHQSSVEVLGTAFNVRSIEGQKNVQVAVVEGKVSFKSEENGTESEQLAVLLSKNQYGYLDLENRAFDVDDLAVENYLAWKDGRLVFDGMTLAQVCIQFNRIYGKECSFGNERIANLKLTSNFSSNSMEKTMEVIAMTLEIDYEAIEDRVHWSQNE